MKVSGIVCEYNPFHKGHEYHIAKTKENCDYIVCVMSGSFTQRGEPALTDKWTRAHAALAGGADVVIELPSVYALSSAEMFAFGAVSLLSRLGVCDSLSFGANAFVEELESLALLMTDNPDFDALVRSSLSSGLSYPAALAEAVKGYSPHAELLSNPNNVLGLEYIKAIHRLQAEMTPVVVERIGSAHGDEILGELSSSRSIRKAFQEGDTPAAFVALPASSRRELYTAYGEGRFSDKSRYELLCLAALRQSSREQLSRLADLSEGLNNRLAKAASLPTLEDVISYVKTKRYTHARIARLLAYCTLGITSDTLAHCHYAGGASYARILGFKRSAAPLLERMKACSTIPVLSSAAAMNDLQGAARVMLDIDIKATDLHALTLTNPVCRKGAADYTHPLVIL